MATPLIQNEARSQRLAASRSSAAITSTVAEMYAGAAQLACARETNACTVTMTMIGRQNASSRRSVSPNLVSASPTFHQRHAAIRTDRLTGDEIEHLRKTTVLVLREWTERLRAETGEGFPSKVTAFRPEMAVHGKYGKPCPACGSAVQRIIYAENESNYCARCQTGGKLLADRSLSRLMKDNWPKTIDELEGR